MPDMRHRAALHNAFGCYLVEKVFGHTLINSDGKEVSTREIAENHIIEDLGYLPSLEDWLDELPMSKWHGGIHRLPKDERTPTPAETREATRARTMAQLAEWEITLSHDGLSKLIAAVTGSSEHQDD